jgi:TATA-box binding protein (TBP) (component of TFIID and TFIIIB)
MDFNIDAEWESFVDANKRGDTVDVIKPIASKPDDYDDLSILPKCEELYISTTTKVLYLNRAIDINNIYWEIPIVDYWKPECGVIKKQMKIVSHTKEEYNTYCEKLPSLNYYTEHIIKSIDNPAARRNKFKDERKITVGLSKRDIMNCRGKVKNAFYNCFALILRFTYKGDYREIHAKIFNTGKMEIPGILNVELLEISKDMILSILSPVMDDPIEFINTDVENNVLINSNFNCGFYINRDKLYSILRNKYNIETAYDPCSYPGVKCKFYYKNELGIADKQCGSITVNDHSKKVSELNNEKKYTEVSFMIFRTGSCLIVGNCTEKILRFVYNFIKEMLQTEYSTIMDVADTTIKKVKQVKIRKKTIIVSGEYYRKYAN